MDGSWLFVAVTQGRECRFVFEPEGIAAFDVMKYPFALVDVLAQ